MNEARLWLCADRDPDAVALTIGGEELSRAALARRADALAHRLAKQGVRIGSVVAALLPNGVDFVALLNAVDRCGAVLLPLNIRHTVRELAHPLRETGARMLVHDGGALAEIAEEAARRVAGLASMRVPRDAGEAPPLRPASISRDAALAILYTSGTTGRAKGAVLTHSAFRASVLAWARHLGSRPDDRWLACMPLFHVGGLSILLRGALGATPVVLQARFDPAAVASALDAERVTLLSLVPTMLARLLDARRECPPPPTLRCVLLGGAAAPPSLISRAVRLGYPLAPTYGLTEAASQVATLRPAGDPLCDGLEPLPGTEIRILGSQGVDARARQPGEILVRSAALMRRYEGRPEATRRAIRDGWLHTGDIGWLDARGGLHLLERRSDLIVSGGENVYPAEVEAVLCEHPAVREAAVAPIPDRRFGARPAAWMVPSTGGRPGAGELERFCGERLARYKIPVRYHWVASLPRTSSGKLQRSALRDG